MQKVFMKICSMVLTIVLLCNMLPLNVFAEEIKKPSGDVVSESSSEKVHVVEEVKEQRTEFTKQFKLSNGLHLAAVYAEPVHYEKDGQWQEIDNTLKVSGSGLNTSYTNAAGLWDVSFPQQLSGQNPVSIEKDGYTLSFYMSGELRLSANESVMSASKQAETFAVSPMKQTSAQMEKIDNSRAKAEAQYPETVYERGHSRVRYDNVYTNTNIVYDLQGNRVKESVVMGKYDETLRGYRYTLDAENLTPVLEEDGQILLYAKGTKDIVMVMPAPYLIDAAGESSYDVKVTLTPDGSNYTLSYLLPQKWLAEEIRQWPVVLDPVVQANLVASNIQDRTISQIGQRDTRTDGSIECGYTPDYGMLRIFMRYVELPALSSADVIVGAQLSMRKCMTSNGDRLVTVHKLSNDWDYKTITWNSYFGSDIHSNYDHNVTDYQVVRAEARYYWDITDIARSWYEDGNTGMLFRMVNEEELSTQTLAQFWSVDYTANNDYKPVLEIEFRNNNGLESYWDYTASSAGRAGTGYINNYTGNLVWVRGDIGFDGNRMPVFIDHVYNANDAANNRFDMGYGWRTSFNQLVYQWTVNGNYYVWEDSDGTYHYFEWDSATGKYKDEDNLNMTLEVSSSERTITNKYGNISRFDSSGRLYRIENNQATKSIIQISYDGSSNRISTITDGAGRIYTFSYDSFANVDGKLLTKISYSGTGSTEVSYVNFGYTGALLTSVTDKEGKTSNYSYTTNNLLTKATDIDGYELNYEYNVIAAGRPARVSAVRETHNGVDGGSLSIEYAHNQTTFTDVSDNVQIMQFNNWGNTKSIQDGDGRAQYAEYATDTSSSAKGNQLSLASKLQNTVGNVLDDSSFERSTLWTATSSAVSRSIVSGTAYYGNQALKLTRSSAGTAAGVYSSSFTVGAGETYTFSAYVQTGSGMTAYLALTDGSTTKNSETLAANSGWTRLEVSYTNSTSASKSVTARLMTTTAGTAYMDCVQVEKAPTASRYNLVENGDFWYATTWSSTGGRTTLSPAAGPQLSTNVYKIIGNPSTTNRISQTVKISGNKDDCFVLAGWAKGDSAPLKDNREFSIIATFLNASGSSVGTSKVTFNPDNNSSVAWQYAAAAIIAPAAYSSIKIELAYDYNVNTVYFDGIQLYKEEFGTSYTYDSNGNVLSVTDLQKQITTYEYTDNDLTKQTLPTGAKLTYTYDDHHNVKTATSEEGVVYNFEYDTYGNNTSVSIVSGSVKLTSSASYTTDGNRLATTTDAAGKVTTYSYNADTNVLDWIQYPEDTSTTKTEYTYDNMYRLSRTEADISTGSTLFASYGYTNDLLTSITTGSTTYSFAYGNFALRSNIKIGSRTLASYTYTNRTNYLSSLDYGNGDSVDYTYDQQGRVTKQTYEDGDTVTYKYDNDGALATVTDSATGITTTYYYDFTDRLMKQVESGSGYSHSVGYTYDNINNLTALVETINGETRTTNYSYDDDNRITLLYNGATHRTYAYDAYSRLDSQGFEYDGNTLLTKSYGYKDLSGNTTGQVETVTYAGSGLDRTYTYDYDDNGNIVSVASGGKTTQYTYDSANQLIREDNQAAGLTWVYTYDDAGNILSKKEYPYTTGNLSQPLREIPYGYYTGSWGDLLEYYNNEYITTDVIGNLVKDENDWIYTWEHGRQLSSVTGTLNDPTPSVTPLSAEKNGVYVDSDGETRYYENGVAVYAGLVHWNGYYYYFNSSLKAVRNTSYYVTKNNGLLLSATYEFDAQGRMINAPDSVIELEVDYLYYSDGLRKGKTVTTSYELSDSVTEREYSYVYNGSQLTGLTVVVTVDGATEENHVMRIGYDISGPMFIKYNDLTYQYVTNLQGDVIALLDHTGTVVVEYTYDAWGNILSITGSKAATLGEYNPLRYRGYVYDTETGLYYLQTRYYNPTLGRFINADVLYSTGQGLLGNNMFAYCRNNPVNRFDPTGEIDWDSLFEGVSLLSIGITACVVAAAVVSGGACLPLLVVAGTTFAAGGITVANGASEIIEGVTGNNIMRDTVYKGNTAHYENQKVFFSSMAEAGTAALAMTIDSPNICFVAGTIILAEEGRKCIEEIEKGDLVWACDEETGDVELKEVVEIYINETDELVHVFVNDEEIIATPSHPFYCPVKGWTDAVHLRAGDILVLVNGEYVVVEKVQHEILETPITVYNFQVEDYHTYYVSNMGILVHNMCAKKRDIRQVDAAANQLNMTPEMRNAFGEYIEELKQGVPNNRNFSFKELLEIGREIMEMNGIE